MTAKIAQPRKSSFNHPTTFERCKSAPFFGDDFQVDLMRLFYVGYLAFGVGPRIAAIDPQLAQPRHAGGHVVCQHALQAVPIAHIGDSGADDPARWAAKWGWAVTARSDPITRRLYRWHTRRQAYSS